MALSFNCPILNDCHDLSHIDHLQLPKDVDYLLLEKDVVNYCYK